MTNTFVRMFHVFPSFASGGTELRIVRVMNRLPFSAHHVIVALDGQFGAAARISSSVHFDRAKLRASDDKLPVWIRLRPFLSQFKPHLALTYNWGAIEGVLAARLFGRCAILHNESGLGQDEASVLRARRVWVRRLVLRGIDKTIVNSRTMLRIAENEFRLPSARIAFIRNGVDTAQFAPANNLSLRQLFGVEPETVLFGFVGVHRAEKNLRMMIEAFIAAELFNAKLMFVGDGPCRRRAQELVTRLGRANQILFTGEVHDPWRYLQALDVFVMSSVTEQTPNALLEAMACGLPAIGTDVGDISEILGANGAPQVVPVHDVERMARSMRIMAEDRGLRGELGSKNRSRCVEHYSLDRMVAEFSEVYLSAVRSSAATTRRGQLPC
jgi:glycosyltransferase involved in cell wall biosynthesis